MLDKDLKKYFPGNPKHLQKVDVSYKRKVDGNLVSSIDNFIIKSLEDFKIIGLNKIVVGISGGVDSVVTSALLRSAIGGGATGVIVNFEVPNDNANLAIESADKIGIEYVLVKAGDLFQKHLYI